jgi:hypothetical protein
LLPKEELHSFFSFDRNDFVAVFTKKGPYPSPLESSWDPLILSKPAI